MTVELEAKPTEEMSSAVPVIEYAESVTEDILKDSREAIENGIHSACLQGTVPQIRVSMNITLTPNITDYFSLPSHHVYVIPFIIIPLFCVSQSYV